MPRAVVTGGAGFIGSHMVDLLVDRGYSVVVIDNLVTGRAENLARHRREPRVAFHEIDMCTVAADSRLFKDVDHVFHFGGIGDIVPSIERPLEYMRANVDGTLAVLEASRHAGVRKFVYAASSSCYGMATELPTTEQAPIRPEYPYALSKYLGESTALHWAQVYRLPVISIRMFNVYGPRVRTTGAYGAVFGSSWPRSSTVSRSPWSATAPSGGTSCSLPTWPGPTSWPRSPRRPTRCSTWAPGIPRPSTGSSS